MELLIVIVVLILSYLAGSIPSGWIVVKIANGKDVREIGSGRTGGTNAMRAAGLLAGALTGILDASKGYATYWIVGYFSPEDVWLRVFAALMAVIGHNYSLFMMVRDENGKIQFGGGAGGATVFGGAMALYATSGLIIFPLSALVYIFVGYASVTTMSIALFAVIIFSYRAIGGLSPWQFIVYGLLAELIVVWALRPNIKRLRLGTERVVGLRAYYLKNKTAFLAKQQKNSC